MILGETMKNSIKFFLKLIITAVIIAGIIFGGVWLFSPKSDSLAIVKASNNAELIEKYKESYSQLEKYSYSSTYSGEGKVNTDVVIASEKISDVLTSYYSYYLTLSPFENNFQKAKKNEIIEKINKLKVAIDETTNCKTIALKSTENGSYEYNARVLNWANYYTEQMKIFFELNGLLKDYIYLSNYNSSFTGIGHEVKLQMMEDYSKVAFDEGIYGKLTSVYTPKIIATNASEKTLFTTVYTKFVSYQDSKEDANNGTEMTFINSYKIINSAELLEYYKLVSDSEKREYVNTLENDKTKRSANISFAKFKCLFKSIKFLKFGGKNEER